MSYCRSGSRAILRRLRRYVKRTFYSVRRVAALVVGDGRVVSEDFAQLFPELAVYAAEFLVLQLLDRLACPAQWRLYGAAA